MFKNKKIVAVIPARGGSKGLPRKNIRLLCGKPLIAHSIDVAKQSKYLDGIYVSTEDGEIANSAKEYGAQVISRPLELAGDDVSTRAVLKHVITELEVDAIVLLFPTLPLRSVEDIDLLIELFDKKSAKSASTITEVENHPYWMTQIENDSKANFFNNNPIITERQKLPKYYVFGNTAIISREHIKKDDNYFLSRSENYGLVVPEQRCIDIHEEHDLIVAEILIKNIKRCEL